MIRTSIFPGRYIQGLAAMQRLGGECVHFGKKGLFICDASSQIYLCLKLPEPSIPYLLS